MSVRVRFLKVEGGYYTDGGSKDSDKSAKSGAFMVKRSVIVRESDLSGLMRRDWELCSLPIIKISNTNERCIDELPVRY